VDEVLRGRRVAALVPAEHARWLIEEAYRVTLASGRTAPPEFARARIELGEAKEPTEHPALALAKMPYEAFDLHTLEEVGSWVPPKESLEAVDLEVGNITTSKLVVSPAGRKEQLSLKLEQLCNALPESFRKQIERRLYETALLYAARKPEVAAYLVETAATVASGPAWDNRFWRRMFEKLVPPDLFESNEETKERP
jgi:hypothetical protein